MLSWPADVARHARPLALAAATITGACAGTDATSSTGHAGPTGASGSASATAAADATAGTRAADSTMTANTGIDDSTGTSGATQATDDASTTDGSTGGNAGPIELLGTLSLTGLAIHDLWAWTNIATRREYAILGASTDGLIVVDVTDRTRPTEVAFVENDEMDATDIKTWQTFAYVSGSEGLQNGTFAGQVLDLSDPTQPAFVGTFPAAHNLFVSEDGYLFAAAPGLRIYDLNADPTDPPQVYSDNACPGHDVAVVGTRLFEFTGSCGTRIYDIAVPTAPQLLGTVVDPEFYHHAGWPSADGNFLLLTNELASPTQDDIVVWDISDPATPAAVGQFNDPEAYVHNIYVAGDRAYVAYYRAGFRVFDVGDPTQPTLLDQYDTAPTLRGPGFGGNFGLYVFTSDGAIFASDEDTGLYVFAVGGR